MIQTQDIVDRREGVHLGSYIFHNVKRCNNSGVVIDILKTSVERTDISIGTVTVPLEELYCALSVCACHHLIYSERQSCGHTSRGHTGGRPHRIFTPFFCGACLIFL